MTKIETLEINKNRHKDPYLILNENSTKTFNYLLKNNFKLNLK